MAATISPRIDEAVAAAPPETAASDAGAAAQQASAPAPARSRGVRRLVVFIGKRRPRARE
jgi:hypothetical protein